MLIQNLVSNKQTTMIITMTSEFYFHLILVFGGLTKLFFGKSAKVPNMQVGDKNVMHIGRHFDDSDDDDYMPDSSYDKTYQPPSKYE